MSDSVKASALAGLFVAMAAMPMPLHAQANGTAAPVAPAHESAACVGSRDPKAVAESLAADRADSVVCGDSWSSPWHPGQARLRSATRSPIVPAPGEAQRAAPFSAEAAESLDLRIARAIRRTDLQESGTVRAVAGVFRLASLPGTLLLAGTLYGIGEIEDRRDLSDLGILTGQAILGAGAVTLTGKVVAGRARPRISPDDASDFGLGRGLRGNDFQAFPSAHTAAAFATGTVLATDIADRHPGSAAWVYPSIYAAASLAGLSRMFDEEHWASDIVAGALIGIAGGLLVNEMHEDAPVP